MACFPGSPIASRSHPGNAPRLISAAPPLADNDEGRKGGRRGERAGAGCRAQDGGAPQPHAAPRGPTRPHAAPTLLSRSPTQPHAAHASGCVRLWGGGGRGLGTQKGLWGFVVRAWCAQWVLGWECKGTGGQEEGGGHKEVVMRSGVLFWEVGLWTPILSPQLTGVTERPAVMSGVLPVPTFLCWVCGWKAEPASSSGRERMAPSKPF